MTKTLGSKTLSWGSADGLGEFRQLKMSQAKGDVATASVLSSLAAHAATHVDAPCHFVLVRRGQLNTMAHSTCSWLLPEFSPSGALLTTPWVQEKCSTGGTLENLSLDMLIGEA